MNQNHTATNKKFIVTMPKTYTELLVIINILTFLNRKEERILIYNPDMKKTIQSSSSIQTSPNLFEKYKIAKENYVEKYFINDKKVGAEFQMVEKFDILINFIIKKNIRLNIREIFNNEFASKQMLTRQYIRKKINNKELVIFHMDKTSIKNIVYYILCIHTLYKLDQVDTENKEFTINDDYRILLLCTSEKSESENIIVCQQAYHQITLLLPQVKNILVIGNKLLHEHIEQHRDDKENATLMLYNLSSYVNIITDEQLLFCISLFPISNTNFIFPNKIISPQIKKTLASNFKIVDIHKIKSQEDINGRFYPV